MREYTECRLNPISTFIVAGTAGALSRTAVNGLGVTKTMGAVGVPGGTLGMLQAVRWTAREIGPAGFFRAEMLNASKAFAQYGIMFTTYNQLARALVPHRPAHQQHSLEQLAAVFLTGAVSGVAGTIITHPLDVARTRYMVAPFNGTAGAYPSELGVLSKILAQEGIYAGLYRGLSVSLIGGSMFAGCLFTMLDIDYIPFPNIMSLVHDFGFYQISSIESYAVPSAIVFGTLIALHPIDVAQSSVLPNGGGAGVKVNGLVSGLMAIRKNSGTIGLWTGLNSTLFRVAPQMAVFALIFKGATNILGAKISEPEPL